MTIYEELAKNTDLRGETIYEIAHWMAPGNTTYEVLNELAKGNNKFEALVKYARDNGFDGNWQTMYEVIKDVYNVPIDYYKLNPDISTDEEFNNLPWGRKINTIELDGTFQNNTWYTITFPFNCKRSDFVLGNDKLSICKVLKIKGVTDTEAYYDSALIGDSGDIEANYPYQMYNHSGETITQLLAENVLFTTNHTKESEITIGDGWNFIGCYLKKMYGIGTTKEYMVNNGVTLQWVDENGVEVKAYSGIFHYVNPNPQ